MRDILKTEELTVPEGVEVTVKARLVSVKGPRGSLTKNLRHANVDIRLIKGQTTRVTLAVWQGGRKHVAVLNTLKSLINNMIIGVTKVRRYILRRVVAGLSTLHILGLPIQDARSIRPFPHQLHRPGEWQQA